MESVFGTTTEVVITQISHHRKYFGDGQTNMEPNTSMSLENLTSLFLNETEMDKAEGPFNMEEKAQGYWMYKVGKDDCFC